MLISVCSGVKISNSGTKTFSSDAEICCFGATGCSSAPGISTSASEVWGSGAILSLGADT